MRYAILLLMLASCSLSEALEGAGCRSNADCDSSQACVKTLHQEMNGNIGTCSSSGSCKVNEQAGCGCDSTYCSSGLFGVEHPTLEDPVTGAALCFCCPSSLCGDQQTPHIFAVRDQDGSASCGCCPSSCPGGQEVTYEMDGDEIVDCFCECPAGSDTDTDSGSTC